MWRLAGGGDAAAGRPAEVAPLRWAFNFFREVGLYCAEGGRKPGAHDHAAFILSPLLLTPDQLTMLHLCVCGVCSVLCYV